MSFRRSIFWIHLAAGLIAGISIGIMCLTGTVLAFEKELVAWSERDVRRVAPPFPGAPRLTLVQLQAKLREAQPDARPASLVLQNDPGAAVLFSTGRTGGFYANPYTGEVRAAASGAMADFMRTMTAWHRTLGFTGETSRPQGKLINGVCNLAFCALAITGLYLWMPRTWTWRALRPVIWFRQNSGGKARDFNWHNAIGFWTAPVLIVLTLTAVPISFQWGGRVIQSLTGSPASSMGPGGGPGGAAPVEISPPAPGAVPLAHDALVHTVQQAMPDWKTLTLRLSNEGGSGRGGPGPRGGEGREGREGRPARSDENNAQAARASGPQAINVTVREASSWPRTAATTLAVNPYTGEVVRRTGFAEMNAAQQVRSWTRFLHTGEALGGLGQLLAGVACLGGVFLVYTGFALSWRRFFGRRVPSPVDETLAPVRNTP